MLTALTNCLAAFSTVTGQLVEANKETRLFATYFRVALFGDKFGEENNGEYIYRMNVKENLMTMQQYLKTIIQNQFGATDDEIKVLGNSIEEAKKIQKNQKPGIFYLQVAMVHPNQTGDSKTSAFRTHFGVREFLMESASGKGDMQTKKKTIFKVQDSFPCITMRLPIISTAEVVLSPLESAIDLIRDRVARFDAELNVKTFDAVRINQLQQLLQGSVAPMVHEGPMKIFDTYLGEDRHKYPTHQTQQLEEAMNSFIKRCGFGVKLVNQVIEQRDLKDYKAFQVMIEDHYKVMRTKLEQYRTS